ncbi:hypothetical protein I656_01457 [Geobacillus sp. WSUCF1]|nr:hypothetical protein I656_01457 [Geobacillus sp. WSUCF1]
MSGQEGSVEKREPGFTITVMPDKGGAAMLIVRHHYVVKNSRRRNEP